MNPNAEKSSSASDPKPSALHRPNFDTMLAVENLKEAEFREQQAVAIVETIQDAQFELATREDLQVGLERLELVLRSEFRTELENFRNELRTELRAEIGSLRGEINDLRGDVNNFRSDMQGQLATMYWRLLVGTGGMVGIFGTIIALVVTLSGGE